MGIALSIPQELQARWPNWAIEWFEEIDSTNSYLMRHSKLGEKRICIADVQTMGRGRRGKDWATPKGNIAISLAFEYKEISRISQLAPRVGAEIARAFAPLISDVQVKWPNDVLVDGQKLAGILVESSISGNRAQVVVGVGVNLHINPTIDGRSDVTSFMQHCLDASPSEVVDRVINAVNQAIPPNDTLPIDELFAERDYFAGKTLKLDSGEQGTYQGLGQEGELLLRTDYGLKAVWSVNTSVRAV